MASTTDPNKPGTGLHGEGALDALTDTGGTDRYATEEQHGIVTGEFDREINLRGIVWSGVWLAVVTIVANVLVWWFLRGFQVYDQRHEVPVMPMAAQHKQQPPAAPLLQPENPADDRNLDMLDLRAQEDVQLNRASQVGNTLRVPVDVAIDAIAKRGVAPFPATGAPSVPAPQSPETAQNPVTTPPPTAKPPAQ
ncbi:MAG: hypothetical protein ACJ76N_05500 [Thermoanaerobaculia bacterium]